MRVRLDHVLSELILEQSSLSREFPPWNDPSWSCRRNRPHHLQEGCRAVQHRVTTSLFGGDVGTIFTVPGSKNSWLWVKTRYMTDSNKRFLCRRKNRRRARCSHHMRLETEPKETKFVTYRNKSVGCCRCSVDMCVFVFCIPTGYITLNWQWQNLKYQNTVD